MKQCLICGVELPNPLDEFGDRGEEVCRDCWFEYGNNPGTPDSWYGLGPHKHAYDERGNIIIGGTTFDPLPEPDKNGDYIINGLRFTPDPEAPGLGVWSRP